MRVCVEDGLGTPLEAVRDGPDLGRPGSSAVRLRRLLLLRGRARRRVPRPIDCQTVERPWKTRDHACNRDTTTTFPDRDLVGWFSSLI